jgi:hypothetical protein
MFGRAKHDDIPVIDNYECAVKCWGDIMPIRGRSEDVRPLGKRSKDQMRIVKNATTGNVHCYLYSTPVVTYHPDNTITLNVPEQWRTNTTAGFMSQVLGRYRADVGIRDGNIIIALKGPTCGFFRIGTETKFKITPSGLDLIGGNIVNITHSVNRKVMNAARKEVSGFVKYLKASHNLREGNYSVDEMRVLMQYLHTHGFTKDLEEPGKTSNVKWTLYTAGAFSRANPEFDAAAWCKRVRFAHRMMKEGTTEDWYVLSLWLVGSNYWWQGQDTIFAHQPELLDDITELLMVLTPNALIATPEPYGEIHRDRNRKAADLIAFINEVEER